MQVNTIYLIALEMTIIFTIIFIFPMKIALIFSIILIGIIFIFSFKKEIVLILIPTFFLIRVVTSINFNTFNKNQIINAQISVHNSLGKIEKINGKFLPTLAFANIENCENGKYNIVGKIIAKKIKYNNTYYSLKTLEKKRIKTLFLKNYFFNLSNRLLKNSSYQLKRVFKAVILGESQYLTKSLKYTFSYLGISHILALSGFHMGIIISIFTFILNKFNINKIKKNMILLIFLTIYYLGINHSPSLNRAYFMCVIFLLGNIFYENTELIKSLTLSYIISLFIFPTTLKNISFKLSYSAVFIIATIFPIVKKWCQRKNIKVSSSILLIFTLQLFLTPIILNEFGTVQILSFISNIILIPLGSAFITISFLGLLLENIYLGFLLSPFMKFSYWIFIKFTTLLKEIPYMSIKYNNGFHSTTFYFVYFILLFIIIYFNTRKEKTNNEKIYKRDKISQ